MGSWGGNSSQPRLGNWTNKDPQAAMGVLPLSPSGIHSFLDRLLQGSPFPAATHSIHTEDKRSNTLPALERFPLEGQGTPSTTEKCSLRSPREPEEKRRHDLCWGGLLCVKKDSEVQTHLGREHQDPEGEAAAA